MSTVVGFVSVYGKGRMQIPSEVRRELQISDGDKIVWKRDLMGKFFIEKAELKREGGRYVRE